MLEEEEFLQADVFLSPPNEGLLSDEDSDDEEDVSAAHLSGPQLSATAEYRINYGNSVVNSLEFDASADEDAVTASTDVRGAFNKFPDFFCTGIYNCRKLEIFQYVVTILLMR